MGPGNLRCDDIIFFAGAHNESCALSLMSALPVNSHRSMEAFASARWLQTAESAPETRDPKSHPSCAPAFLISGEMHRRPPPWIQHRGRSAALYSQGFDWAEATAPRNCVATVSSPIFLPMSFPTSVEKR